MDVLSARGVALLRDLGATLEHRAHRRIRCPPTREGLRFRGYRVSGFWGLRGHGRAAYSLMAQVRSGQVYYSAEV